MPGGRESVEFDFLSHGASQLAGDFKKTGDSAVLAAKGARLLADSLDKQRRATDASAGAALSLAKADRILADAEHVLTDGALEAEFALKKQAEQAQQTARETARAGAEAGAAGGGFSALAGGGGIPGGGIGAAIAAGVILSPIIATVGVGLGGLGLAALAAGKHSKVLAAELAPLKAQFAGFQKELQPVVLTDFAGAAKLAGTVLKDIEPVTVATGKALAGAFGQIGAEFQSQTWQNFFSFMQRTAGPDVALLTANFVGLLKVLPPLIEALQPLATTLLKDTTGILNLIAAAEKAAETEHRLGQEAATSSGWLGKLAHAAGQAFNELVPGAAGAKKIADELGKFGVSSSAAAAAQAALNARVAASRAAVADLIHPLGSFTGGLASAKTATQGEAAAVTILTAALKGMGGGLLTTEQDQIAWKQAQQAATQAIKANTGSLDSNRASALAARSAIIGSTQAALTFANQEVNVHHNTDAASAVLRAQISYLQAHAGKSRIASQEVDALRAALRKLQGVGNVHESIFMTGKGTWGIFGKNPVNSGLFNAAAGGRVPGAGAGDTVPAMLTPGEAVVPKHLTPAVAPFLKAQGVPGFAAGGIVSSFTGTVPGVTGWAKHNWNASLALISNSMAAGIAAAVKGSLSSSLPSGLGGNVGSWINASLAVNRLPSWWAPLMAVLVSKESGGNPRAENPISVLGQHAEGIAQMLPSTFAAYTRGGSIWNPIANLVSSERYIEAVYGNPRNIAGLLGGTYYGYGKGSWRVPFTGPAFVHKDEMIIPARPAAAIRASGGGTVVNNYVNVQVGHGTHPVAAAQEIAKVLNTGAMSGVKLRTSILGPG